LTVGTPLAEHLPELVLDEIVGRVVQGIFESLCRHCRTIKDWRVIAGKKYRAPIIAADRHINIKLLVNGCGKLVSPQPGTNELSECLETVNRSLMGDIAVREKLPA